MGKVARNMVAIVASTAIIAILLAGCAPKGPTYVETGKNYDRALALELLSSVDASSLAGRLTSDGPALRHTALAALRRHDAEASAIADLITRTFPSDTTGVPLYIERGSFNNTPAVIVVEATGPASGQLNSKRIWFVGEKGDILFAGSR